MHEASLALSLAEMLIKLAQENNAHRVLKAKVRVGPLSNVVVESFVFAFELLKENYSELKETELCVEEVPIKYRCRSCQTEFELQLPFFAECPSCSSADLEMLSGDEFDLVDVELECKEVDYV